MYLTSGDQGIAIASALGPQCCGPDSAYVGCELGTVASLMAHFPMEANLLTNE